MNSSTRLLMLTLLVIPGVFVATNAFAYTPVFDNTHVLTNGPLSIEVMDPVAADRQDQFVRFSPLAWMIQANHRDVDYFYAPADRRNIPWNGGNNQYFAGNPMEFDLGDFDIRPPGFDEATLGSETDEFIKIGVGILARTVTGSYNLSKPYQFVAANNQATFEADRATFTQTLPRETDTGYRYELETTMQLIANEVHLTYNLTNNGSKAFETAQYLHNFTSIADSRPSSSSEVEVPWSFVPENNLSLVLRQNGNKLVYLDNITRSRKPVIPVDNLGDAPFEFTVRQTDIDEQYVASATLPDPVDGATAEPLAVAIWNDSSGLQFSPEQFVRISLEPGRSIEWSRTYTFGVIPEPTVFTLSCVAGLMLSLTRGTRLT